MIFLTKKGNNMGTIPSIGAILSKDLVFQTFEEGSSVTAGNGKGGSRFTGKSDYFGASESLNAALTSTKLPDYVSNIGMTLIKVLANLPANATFHLLDICSVRVVKAIAGLVVNVVAKVFVIVALLGCLLAACAGVKIAKHFFVKIEEPENIRALEIFDSPDMSTI